MQKVQVSADEIREWEGAFLVPSRNTPGLDPRIFDAEVGAADFLTSQMAWLTGEVRVGRTFMRECVEGDKNPSVRLSSMRDAFKQDAGRNGYGRAFGWFFAVLKLLGGFPLQIPIGLEMFPRGKAPQGSETFPCGQFEYRPVFAPHDMLVDWERNDVYTDPDALGSEDSSEE